MPNKFKEQPRHYRFRASVKKILEKKLRHLAKQTAQIRYSDSDKIENQLRKEKSEYLGKIEDSLESLILLLNGLKRPVGIEYFSIIKKGSKKSYQRSESFQSLAEYFQQKSFEEFESISQRIFTLDRVKELIPLMFPEPLGRKLDLNDRIREGEIAITLLIAAMSVLRRNLDSRYYKFLVEDLNRAQELANAILGELKRSK